MKTLKLNSRGHEVKQLQALLNITQDGIFGPQTNRAVQNFQRSNNITVDGIVGPITWSLLFSTGVSNTPSMWHDYHLPEEAYFKNPTKKKWIFLHHTARLGKPLSSC
jgi:peptidoglycan hydrolase-like protein with peptidoglycan-binding domain